MPKFLQAESLSADPLTGSGDYEFLFYSGDKKPDIEAITARFREFDPELKKLHDELASAESAIAEARSKHEGRRAQKLEWSPIEGATGYSVKLFDAKKKLIETKHCDENSLTLELEQGSYFFQVAALTAHKTGAYSRLTAFALGRGKPGATELAAAEQAETLREKIRIQRKIRGEYLQTLRAWAIGSASAQDAHADLAPPANAVYYLAFDKKVEPYAMSQVMHLPGRGTSAQASATLSTSVAEERTAYSWGAGGVFGVQDTRLTYFRPMFGVEGYVRREKPFLKYFYPQFKMTATYSPSKSVVYDSMLYANFYPGVYYPLSINQKFRVLFSLSTGANMFFLLSSAASASVLQWGFMPALEVQYAVNSTWSLYAGAALNLTYDTNAGSGFFSSDSWLKFFPLNLGVTRRF